MYHPTVISNSIDKLSEAYGLQPIEYSVAEVSAWVDRLAGAVDDKGNPKRPLTNEESQFIQNELILTKSSYKYWAERYCKINVAGQGIERMYPLLSSQDIIVREMGKVEHAIFKGEREDGILLNLLKGGRQMGGSTLAESILAHRSTTQNNLQGLIASDVPGEDGSGYLFGMYERIIDNLPWWLCPKVEDRVKNSEISFDGGSHLWVGAGKSIRGTAGKRGQLGRGKTLSLLHLSELSTWEAPDQIDSALMPTVPSHWRSFALFESTAKGQNNWWHKHWKISRDHAGSSRFIPVFIPWYAETSRYAKNPPADWIPKESTLAYAKRAEALGPRWVHRRVNLTKEQLYWYEFTRSLYEIKGDLKTFLEEYGAVDDEECFQFTGRSIFPLEVIQRIVDKAKPLLAVVEIGPPQDVLPSVEAGGPIALPPGLGLRILPKKEWQGLLSEDDGLDNLKGFLLIWELPRKDQAYVLSADISDGIGQDNSVLDLTRIATIKEPDEQVAQFVTNIIDPIGFAFIIDAAGRLYKDGDGAEALAAVETNNHGLVTQSELQNHLGYNNFFVWQRLDSADPSKRNTNALGWETNRRTRPFIINRYVRKVKTVDENGVPDYIINSPFTVRELRTFHTLASLAEAEADPTNPDATDDAIMTGCIGVHVSQTLHYDVDEDLDSQRRRIAAERARKNQIANNMHTRRDFNNTDCTVDEMSNSSTFGDN